MKSKSGGGYGDPLEMVTAEKMRRIRRAAEAWLAFRLGSDDVATRFDVVAVRGRRLVCFRAAF